MASKTVYTYRVEPSDVDFTGRIRPVGLIGFLLRTAGTDADAKGFGVRELVAEGRSWVLSRMRVHTFRLPSEWEPFTVTTWVSDYGRAVTTRNFTVEDATGKRIAEAVTLWAMIDFRTRRSVDLRYVAERRDALCTEPSPVAPPDRIPAPEAAERTTHPVVYSDIDFNRHVGSLRYLELMFDRLPAERFGHERSKRLDVHFVREARWGDVLEVSMEEQQMQTLFEIAVQGTTVCRARLAEEGMAAPVAALQ